MTRGGGVDGGEDAREMDTTKVKLKILNDHITCHLCVGYLIGATVITECLHRFCKSCIVKHLEENNTCPECGTLIHHSHPLKYVRADRTMQDIVYKLVPHLEESELRRQREFYKRRVMSSPTKGECDTCDDQINVCLQCTDEVRIMKRQFIRCSTELKILQLKKFVAKKVLSAMENYNEVDITCDGTPLREHFSLRFVCVTMGKFGEPFVILQYQIKENE